MVANQTRTAPTPGTRSSGLTALLSPDTRRLGGVFDVHEAGRRVVRYQMVTFHIMRLLAGWMAKIPEYELKLEIGRHVWQDAQAAESLKQRTSELRIPTDADRRPPVNVQAWLDAVDAAESPLQFLVGVYRIAKPRLCALMQYHAAATDLICDAPSVRVLRLIVAELADQIAWGEMAIQALCADDAERVRQASTWQAQLEAALADAGGLVAEGPAQASAPDTTPELAMQSITAFPGARTPRSERLLVASRDARFYIDLSPRVLPEDDDPPELLELEAALEARRRTSDMPADSELHEPQGERGLPPPIRLAERDDRFDLVAPAEQAERMPPPGDDWVEKARRLMHGMLDNEMHAAEISGRNSYEFPQMPWEFHIDMARVVWDEIRHSEETSRHLIELGGQIGMYPIVPGNFAYRIQLDLLHRLQDLHRRGELGGLNGLLKSRNTFREMGDPTGALMFDFIQADETRHVAIGNRWVKWLVHDDQEHLKALADEVERQRQSHDTRVASLVRAALGDAGEASDGPVQATDDEPTPVNVISLRIAGFSDDEIAELVQKGGGNAALE